MIGIVFQEPSLDDNLTGKENLDFHGRLYKVPEMKSLRESATSLSSLNSLIKPT